MKRQLTVALAALAMLLSASTVRAAEPLIVHVDETAIDEGLTASCGFEVIAHTTGLSVSITREGPEGQVTFIEIRANFEITLVGPTGKTISFRHAGPLEATYSGLTVTFRFAGSRGLTVVLGEGALGMEAGLAVLTFDEEGFLESFAFHGVQQDALDDEQLCALLAP